MKSGKQSNEGSEKKLLNVVELVVREQFESIDERAMKKTYPAD